MAPKDLFAILTSEIENIEGITLLGGEPFDQAEQLSELAALAQVNNLSVMAFTGYEYDQLVTERRAGWANLLANTDLLVDGPYVKSLPDTVRPWVGSTNQQFRFLTGRYRHLEESLSGIPDRLEVRISAKGEVVVNGMANATEFKKLRRLLRG